MKTVEFTQMKDGTKEDYALLAELEKPFFALTTDRIIAELYRQGEETLAGYKIKRLEHSLQTATRAYRDGADIDGVVGALLHDIGDGLAPQNHDRFSAEILRPFVRDDVTWVVEHHGIFQMIYFAKHYNWDENARDRFKDQPFFQTCADFCERWDQSSFDPDYKTETVAFFEPMVRKVFARVAYDENILQLGRVTGLTP